MKPPRIKIRDSSFFDEVMVMSPDRAVRTNRLALLGQLNQLFLGIADISLLQTLETAEPKSQLAVAAVEALGQLAELQLDEVIDLLLRKVLHCSSF